MTQRVQLQAGILTTLSFFLSIRKWTFLPSLTAGILKLLQHLRHLVSIEQQFLVLFRPILLASIKASRLIRLLLLIRTPLPQRFGDTEIKILAIYLRKFGTIRQERFQPL